MHYHICFPDGFLLCHQEFLAWHSLQIGPLNIVQLLWETVITCLPFPMIMCPVFVTFILYDLLWVQRPTFKSQFYGFMVHHLLIEPIL